MRAPAPAQEVHWQQLERLAGRPITLDDALSPPNAAECRSASRLPPARCRALLLELGGSWVAVLAPLWVADALRAAGHLLLFSFSLSWTPSLSVTNARIEHASGVARALLYAAFKVLLLARLTFGPPIDADAPPSIAAARTAAPAAGELGGGGAPQPAPPRAWASATGSAEAAMVVAGSVAAAMDWAECVGRGQRTD